MTLPIPLPEQRLPGYLSQSKGTHRLTWPINDKWTLTQWWQITIKHSLEITNWGWKFSLWVFWCQVLAAMGLGKFLSTVEPLIENSKWMKAGLDFIWDYSLGHKNVGIYYPYTFHHYRGDTMCTFYLVPIFSIPITFNCLMSLFTVDKTILITRLL